MTILEMLEKYQHYNSDTNNLNLAYEIVENICELIDDAKINHGNDWTDITVGEFFNADLEGEI